MLFDFQVLCLHACDDADDDNNNGSHDNHK